MRRSSDHDRNGKHAGLCNRRGEDANGNTRLFAGIVGGVIVEQIEQESILTPTGSATVGDIWTVVLSTTASDAVTFKYTVVAGDTLAIIATGLRSLIDADPNYVATVVDVLTNNNGTAKGVKVVLATQGKAFNVAYSTSSDDKVNPASGSTALSETPFEQRLQSAAITLSSDINQNGTVSTFNLSEGGTASESIRPGEIWTITLNGTDWTATPRSPATTSPALPRHWPRGSML